ncbi:MAG TPA: peptide chain release factor N(5)-glutamine methyltransferase [Lachnospiraceae bacterium]|jgi:release factor glutamine methyltransferase|nr:peptide chain release factor N(5)-glutamine methyltransferase [Lachnospiraceae bacterium]HBW53383.1 peptide chain release factor N(5)-glutamine methyltransferase [Lachnospiraceae bacterium]
MRKTMTWQALMKEELERLRQADIPEADSDIRLLAMDVAGCTYSTLILRMAEEVTEKQAQRLHAYVTERMTHKPCQYILGTQEFMGYEFATAEEVLIPRPETELLVEEACRIAENWKDTPDGRKRRVLDLCCGSGCIGISFSKLRHGRDLVELADISDAAIALTKKNRERLQADCAVIQTDLFMQIEGKYDMIVSNPPYIRTDEIPKLMAEVRDFEPHLALDGKADGLYFYDKIIREAREYLYEDGYILFEIGQNQLDAVRGLLVENGYTDIKGIKDYAGLDRIVTARYLKSCVQ